MEGPFFAKSILSNGKHPTVKEHLEAVSSLAASYGAEISMAKAAELAGLLHDFGKYSRSFQSLLKHETSGINHAVCGATLLNALGKGRPCIQKVVEAINAHHSALVAYSELKPYLDVKEQHAIGFDGKDAALAGEKAYQEAFAAFQRDFPDFQLTKLPTIRPDEKEIDIYNLKSMLMTRMLFSCLVDADYSTSAMEENEFYLESSEVLSRDFVAARQALAEHRTNIRIRSTSEKELNALRDAVFDACSAAAALDPGLFNLTAPTGTGKTLALLQFALNHCEKWNKSRIIVVLPFLSLTEQTAKTYRNIFPDLLEDTSQSDFSESARLYASRWRVPVIITTSVKFFQSLFADRPVECRRLHNIANSVILFDEAQTLPPELTRTTIHAVRELAQNYGCTMVFSTATQPDFSAIQTLENWAPREILPDYADYYAALKRTKIIWRIGDGERMSWEALAGELVEHKRVCTIVNLRRHARELYRQLETLCAKDEVYYLTTDLCPAHRSQVIESVRSRLEAGLPCRVVSTQCIEAGVDLDFDAVYRALAPLDSIVQAAGRCNRNGRLADLGSVVVFRPEDEAYPGDWYRNAAEDVRRLCRDKQLDIHDPRDIQRYYREVFSKLQDKPALEKALKGQDYQKTALEYQLIEKKQGAQVIVPFAAEIDLYNRIKTESEKGITSALIRQAAPITVSCFADETLDKIAERIPFQKRENGMSPFYVLRAQCSEQYSADMGLQLPKDTNFDPLKNPLTLF